MAVLPVHSDHAGGDCTKNENALQPLSENHNSLKPDWQKHVLASSGYLELGMFDDAALILEEIEPEDKTRSEVLVRVLASTWRPRNGTCPRRWLVTS